ncbi:unnamed protein product [Auanema sp. JU1783]|nr:unnamed protein product [Auanema sp. JU1783]
MSTRGRGNVTIKRGALPNLALAGKREDSSSASSNLRGGKRDGRGRGRGRGRGGGRGGGPKQALIQSEGIFSAGLCASEKKVAEKDSGISFSIARKRTKEDDAEDREFRDPGQGWEDMWESDEAEDEKELSELMKDDFISDYRRGDRMPIVLPQQDENQFFNILDKKAKDELLSDTENDSACEEEKPNADDTVFEHYEDDTVTSKFSREAGAIFLQKSKANESIFMLQLPSVLNILAATPPAEERAEKSDFGQTAEPIEPDDKSRTVPKLPSGSKIGSLKVSRSGKVFLVINGVRIDIAKSTNGGQQDGVILLETTTKKEGPAGGILQVKTSEEGTDSVYFLGSVNHFLSGSLGWSEIQPKSAKLNNSYSPTKQLNNAKSASNNDVKEKLASLRKEAATWSSFAERWASPLNPLDND